jgi:aryl-alcohol dehydrogenase-like predicted oxidoreductase
MHGRPISRRDALKVGALATAGLALGPLPSSAFAGAATRDLITKPIPSTGERIPVIGLGTNAYSVDSAEAMAPLREVIRTMPRLGGTVIDTARVYGRAEEVIGEIVEELDIRDEVFIATKTPIRGELGDPHEEIRISMDRLRMDRLDLILIHNLHGLDHLMPAFIEAKEAGTVRYIGMSTSSESQYPAQMEAMRRYPLDFIQVDYSIANRSAADAIIPLAADRGMAVMINVPFGGRGGGAAATFGRVSGRELPDWAAEFGAESWAHFFLKYVVSHPAVTVAIPGTTQRRHLEDNQGAGRGGLPDAAMRRRMEAFWDEL